MCNYKTYKLIDANLIDFVGTDCHRIEHLKILKDFSNTKYFNLLTEKGLLNASL